MRKIAVLTGAVVLGLGAQANAWDIASSTDVGWTSNGINTLGSISNSTYFTAQTGFNSESGYNSDFATQADCTTAYGGSAVARKYGCRVGAVFAGLPDPATGDDGAYSASAAGTLTIGGGGTTLTGTLTIVSTTDEPGGGTTTISTSGFTTTRLGVGSGNGVTAGYNYRTADGSPFGNAWYGVTTTGVYTVNLTGSFSGSSWSINGGSAAFADPNFACQQGGFGGDDRGTLCSRSYSGGGFSPVGSNLGWGMDVDGGGTGASAMGAIDVRDSAGSSTVATLSGVLAALSVDGSGNITTDSGEFRSGSSGSCANANELLRNHIRYDGTGISCGTLKAGLWKMTGTVSGSLVTANVAFGGHIVPVPAAVWLMGSALGLLGWVRRKVSA